jgi:hypothetical protein
MARVRSLFNSFCFRVKEEIQDIGLKTISADRPTDAVDYQPEAFSAHRELFLQQKFKASDLPSYTVSR